MGSNVALTGSNHVCPLCQGDTPHQGGPIMSGSNQSVLVRGTTVAVQGDPARCNGPMDSVQGGSGSVFAGGKPMARLGDATVHGGTIVDGEPSVQIG